MEIGIYGINEQTKTLLKKLEQSPVFLCDEFVSKYEDYKIIKPQELVNYPHVHIIIDTYVYLMKATKFLRGINHKDFSYAQKYFTDNENVYRRFEYKLKCLNYDNILENLDIVVGEKCSLRCKDCSNLMQYYKNPKMYDVEEIIANTNLVLNKIDYIDELRILGGEPFLMKNLHLLIKEFVFKQKVGQIHIYTNATIVPTNIEILKNTKINVKISDYGKLSKKITYLSNLFDENNINYTILKTDKWQDLGGLKYRNYTEKQVANVYSICECKNIPTLLHDKIYPCPYAAHGVNLGAIDFSEYIDINTKENITSLFDDLNYINACNFCSGRSNNGVLIPAAVQVKTPLEF